MLYCSVFCSIMYIVVVIIVISNIINNVKISLFLFLIYKWDLNLLDLGKGGNCNYSQGIQSQASLVH